MVEEIALENGQISDFEGLVTLTLDRVILHTVMHHLSTSTYILNFIKIEETFSGRTDGWTFETHFIRLTRRSRPNKWSRSPINCRLSVGQKNFAGRKLAFRHCAMQPTIHMQRVLVKTYFTIFIRNLVKIYHKGRH